jgi:hypothetical protein
MNLLTSLAVLAVVLTGCGDKKGNPDHDAGNLDVPPPPALGAQIDRLGRPAISTMLIGLLATPMAAQTARKDAYNHASDPATWKATVLETGLTIERALALDLAVFDALDQGLAISQAGCGNALQYSGPPSPTSYQGAAGLFADDQLYVDTSKATCTVYLALEIEQVSSGSSIHTSCGGRTLTHDAIDVTYSVLAAGTEGLDKANGFGPKIVDGVPPHTDVKDTFPFLGDPH